MVSGTVTPATPSTVVGPPNTPSRTTPSRSWLNASPLPQMTDCRPACTATSLGDGDALVGGEELLEVELVEELLDGGVLAAAAAVERVVAAVVEVAVARAAADEQFLYAVEVDPAVPDEVGLPQAVAAVVGVVDGEVVEREVRAVVDEGALVGGDVGVDADAGVDLHLLHPPLEVGLGHGGVTGRHARRHRRVGGGRRATRQPRRQGGRQTRGDRAIHLVLHSTPRSATPASPAADGRSI